MFFILFALLISLCSESTLVPVRVATFPTHMKSETIMHTVKMSAENIPVLTLYESVGSFVAV